MRKGSHVIFIPKGETDMFSNKCRVCIIQRRKNGYAYVKYYCNTGIKATVREDVRLPIDMLVPFPYKKGDTVKVKPFWYSPQKQYEMGVINMVKDNGEMNVFIPDKNPYPNQTIFYTQAVPSRKHRIGKLLEEL